ncbi:hypothetical protein D3C71_1728300 [compost metagenome]
MVDLLWRATLDRLRAQQNLPAAGLQLPGDQVEQGRFAGPVGTDHRVPFTSAQLKLRTPDDVCLAERLVHIA